MNRKRDHKNNGTVHTVNITGVDGSADGRGRCCPHGPAHKLMASRSQDAAVSSASKERNGVLSAHPWVNRLDESRR